MSFFDLYFNSKLFVHRVQFQDSNYLPSFTRTLSYEFKTCSMLNVLKETSEQFKDFIRYR